MASPLNHAPIDVRPSSVRLPDGTDVVVRLQTPFDRGRIAALFAGVSAEARFLRFGTGMPPTLPRRFLDRLANVDGEHHVGLVALHDGVVVAATRYLRRSDLPSEAEVAITVTDAFQRRGLGRLLVETLRDDAAARGIERFTFEVLGANRAARALLAALGACGSVLPTRRLDPC